MPGEHFSFFFRKTAFASDQDRIDRLGFKCCIGIKIKYSTLWVFIKETLQAVTEIECNQVAASALLAGADQNLLQALLGRVKIFLGVVTRDKGDFFHPDLVEHRQGFFDGFGVNDTPADVQTSAVQGEFFLINQFQFGTAPSDL